MEKKKPGALFWAFVFLVLPGGVILVLIFGKKTIQTNPAYIGVNPESMGAASLVFANQIKAGNSLSPSYFSGYQGITIYKDSAGGYLITGNPGIILPSQVIPYWWIASKGLFGSLSKGVGYLIYTFIPKFIANVWNRILPK